MKRYWFTIFATLHSTIAAAVVAMEAHTLTLKMVEGTPVHSTTTANTVTDLVK